MSWPLYLEGSNALVAGLAFGIAFGFLLERGGLADPKKLTGLFYLKDFTMLQVMFSAIAVAAVGFGAMAALGLAEIGAFAVQPTYLWPQLAGGAILGAGFALGGY